MAKVGLTSIDGGKKPDIVKVKVLCAANNPQGFVMIQGECDLDTFEKTRDAFYDQGFLDLIDAEGAKLCVFRDKALAVIHAGTRAQKPNGLIVP